MSTPRSGSRLRTNDIASRAWWRTRRAARWSVRGGQGALAGRLGFRFGHKRKNRDRAAKSPPLPCKRFTAGSTSGNGPQNPDLRYRRCPPSVVSCCLSSTGRPHFPHEENPVSRRRRWSARRDAVHTAARAGTAGNSPSPFIVDERRERRRRNSGLTKALALELLVPDGQDALTLGDHVQDQKNFDRRTPGAGPASAVRRTSPPRNRPRPAPLPDRRCASACSSSPCSGAIS